MTIKLRQVIASLAIWFAAALIAGAGVAYITPLASIETKLADIRVAAMQAPLPPSKDIAVIALDEATLANFTYRSPVDRAFLANRSRPRARRQLGSTSSSTSRPSRPRIRR